MLYGISTGFGSSQIPVAELLARAVPTLHSPQRAKSNFLQVPDIESPRWVRFSTCAKTQTTKCIFKAQVSKDFYDDSKVLEKCLADTNLSWELFLFESNLFWKFFKLFTQTQLPLPSNLSSNPTGFQGHKKVSRLSETCQYRWQKSRFLPAFHVFAAVVVE